MITLLNRDLKTHRRHHYSQAIWFRPGARGISDDGGVLRLKFDCKEAATRFLCSVPADEKLNFVVERS